MSELFAIKGLLPLSAAFFLLLAAREYAAYKKNLKFKYFLTPLVTLSIAGVVILGMYGTGITVYSSWVLIALIFSLVGDTLLMIEEHDHFLHGLFFFLIAHGFYIIAFGTGYEFNSWNFYIAAGLLTGVLFFLVRYRRKFRKFLIPVALYLGMISLMVFFAYSSFNAGYSERAVLLAAGATLFLISDLVLAVNQFIIAIPHSTVITWMLYAPAQFFIALSCLYHY